MELRVDRAAAWMSRLGPAGRSVVCLVLLAAVTGVIALLEPHVPVLSLAVLYLLAILPVAVAWGVVYAAGVAVGGMLVFNFFFLPPLHTLTIEDSRNWFALLVFLVTAVVVSDLAARSRRRAQESALLAQVAGTLLEQEDVGAALGRVGDELAAALGVGTATIELSPAQQVPPAADTYPLVAAGRRIGAVVMAKPPRWNASSRGRVLPGLASLLGVALERERLAREVFEAEALRRSDMIKTAILRAVSHDLRTPLMAILTSASALARPDFVLAESERDELLETVLVEARRLDRLVGNLLDLSRLQAGAATPAAELVAVDDLVVEALEGLGEDGERIEVQLPAEPAAVRVDAHQMQRALANLLENALKYSSPGDPVSVRVSVTRSEALIRVIDRGPGVAPADSERIFAPFQRGPGGESARGAGLGLAIAQGFVEANGGRVWVESHIGQGATFVLALPVAHVEVSA